MGAGPTSRKCQNCKCYLPEDLSSTYESTSMGRGGPTAPVNIDNSTRIAGVIVNGRWMSKTQIDKRLGEGT